MVELPNDLEAEGSVLGGMMVYEDFCAEMASEMEADDFYTSMHRTIFEAIVRLYASGQPVDVIAVANALKGTKVSQLDVHGCSEGVVTMHVSKNHALIVKDLASLRRMARAGEDIVKMSLGHPENVAEVVAKCEGLVFSVADRYERVEVTGMAQAVSRQLDHMESIYKDPASIGDTPTGYHDLDYLIGGVNPGSVYVLAARPGIGKTALAVNISQNVALKKKVLFLSLEMTTEELTTRLLCAEAGVSLSKVNRKTISSSDLKKFVDAADKLASLPINVIDRGARTPTQMAAVVRRQAQEGLGLVVIDYLQLVESDRKYDSVAAEVQSISRSIKAMAKEYRVPVLALAQLNREVEHRKGRPRLSDLRDSGAIEQDADVVMFLSRDPEKQADAFGRVDVDLDVAKHRNGPTGVIQLSWQAELTQFSPKAGRNATTAS